MPGAANESFLTTTRLDSRGHSRMRISKLSSRKKVVESSAPPMRRSPMRRRPVNMLNFSRSKNSCRNSPLVSSPLIRAVLKFCPVPVPAGSMRNHTQFSPAA